MDQPTGKIVLTPSADWQALSRHSARKSAVIGAAIGVPALVLFEAAIKPATSIWLSAAIAVPVFASLPAMVWIHWRRVIRQSARQRIEIDPEAQTITFENFPIDRLSPSKFYISGVARVEPSYTCRFADIREARPGTRGYLAEYLLIRTTDARLQVHASMENAPALWELLQAQAAAGPRVPFLNTPRVRQFLAFAILLTVVALIILAMWLLNWI